MFIDDIYDGCFMGKYRDFMSLTPAEYAITDIFNVNLNVYECKMDVYFVKNIS